MRQNQSFRGPPARPWRKVLWAKQQEFDDSFVDEYTFLAEMQKNVNHDVFEYWECVRDTAAFTQQISCVVIFVVLFKQCLDDTLGLLFLFTFNTILFVLSIMARSRIEVDSNPWSLTLRHTAIFSVLLLVSPVMRTLTAAYSYDTIYAASTLLLLLHLLLTDYSYILGRSSSDSSLVATNTAFLASILLASQLPTNATSFALLALSLILFGMFPVLRRQLKTFATDAYVGLTWLLMGATLGFLLATSASIAALYVFVILAITFGAPGLLIWMQRTYKYQISGPWDEARIQQHLKYTDWKMLN